MLIIRGHLFDLLSLAGNLITFGCHTRYDVQKTGCGLRFCGRFTSSFIGPYGRGFIPFSLKLCQTLSFNLVFLVPDGFKPSSYKFHPVVLFISGFHLNFQFSYSCTE